MRTLLLFGLGGVLMLAGSSWRNAVVVPGPLCEQHAQVLRGAGWENRCSACHAAAEQSSVGWVKGLLGGETDVGPTQTERCMACHDSTITPQYATTPHNLDRRELEVLVAGIHGEEPQGGQVPEDLACSVCHQEHHGADHPLAAMDNTRCQACHTRKVESFATDHPEFDNWPYDRPTAIAFNHATHQAKHFADKQQEFACNLCHQPDSSGDVQLTASFENACASCHASPLETSLAGGVRVFEIPMLDVEALAEAGHPIGEWPESAQGDFDGVLPPTMKLLLAGNPNARRAMQHLGADFQFGDIDPDDPEHLEAAATLARGIQQLLVDLQDPAKLAAARDSVGELPHQLWHEALQRWFPALQAEVDPSVRSDAAFSAAAQQGPSDPRWGIDPLTLSIVYQPTGHADPVLKSWLTAAIHTEGPLRSAVMAEIASPTSPGQCVSCHTIEREESSLASMLLRKDSAIQPARQSLRWQADDRRFAPRPFTKFSHRPHLTQLELRDCAACHTIDPAANSPTFATTADPHASQSDFMPVQRSQCVSCHNPRAASDRCTTCHNYHVGAVPSGFLQELPGGDPPDAPPVDSK